MPRGAETSCVTAVLLAAGSSTRFGEANKLLAEIDGQPLVRRVAERLLESRASEVVAVTGFEADRVREALAGLDVEFAHNPDHADGIASSLRYGVAALPDAAQGAMIVLADMPGITPAFIDRLIDAFEEEGGGKIVFPVEGDGGQRNPVIWPRRFFAELLALQGDRGAKHLINAHRDDTVGVFVDDDEYLFDDIDTLKQLAEWQGKSSP